MLSAKTYLGCRMKGTHGSPRTTLQHQKPTTLACQMLPKQLIETTPFIHHNDMPGQNSKGGGRGGGDFWKASVENKARLWEIKNIRTECVSITSVGRIVNAERQGRPGDGKRGEGLLGDRLAPSLASVSISVSVSISLFVFVCENNQRPHVQG